MGLFAILCSFVVAADLLAQREYPEGVLVMAVGVWLAVLALLGVWLVWLLYLST